MSLKHGIDKKKIKIMQHFFELKSLIFITWQENCLQFWIRMKSKTFQIEDLLSFNSSQFFSQSPFMFSQTHFNLVAVLSLKSRARVRSQLVNQFFDALDLMLDLLNQMTSSWRVQSRQILFSSGEERNSSGLELMSLMGLFVINWLLFAFIMSQNKFLCKNRPVAHCEHQFVPLLQPICSRVGEAVLQSDGFDASLKWFRVA